MRLLSDYKISVTSKHVRHALQFTDDIVKNFSHRLAGSDSCNRAGEAIAEEFSLHCDSNSVKRESFAFHPAACVKIVRPVIILYSKSKRYLCWQRRRLLLAASISSLI